MPSMKGTLQCRVSTGDTAGGGRGDLSRNPGHAPCLPGLPLQDGAERLSPRWPGDLSSGPRVGRKYSPALAKITPLLAMLHLLSADHHSGLGPAPSRRD